jgi:hypothetical protein
MLPFISIIHFKTRHWPQQSLTPQRPQPQQWPPASTAAIAATCRHFCHSGHMPPRPLHLSQRPHAATAATSVTAATCRHGRHICHSGHMPPHGRHICHSGHMPPRPPHLQQRPHAATAAKSATAATCCHGRQICQSGHKPPRPPQRHKPPQVATVVAAAFTLVEFKTLP